MVLHNPMLNDYPEKVNLSTTRWTCPGWYFAATGNTAVLVNTRTMYFPIFVEQAHTFIRIGVDVTTIQAGGLVRLGIFNWNNGLPGTEVLDAGTISTTVAGIQEIVISTALGRGYYFTAYRGENAAVAGATLQGPNIASAIKTPVSGWQPTAGTFMAYVGLYGDGAWGVAPSAQAYAVDNAVLLREE